MRDWFVRRVEPVLTTVLCLTGVLCIGASFLVKGVAVRIAALVLFLASGVYTLFGNRIRAVRRRRWERRHPVRIVRACLIRREMPFMLDLNRDGSTKKETYLLTLIFQPLDGSDSFTFHVTARQFDSVEEGDTGLLYHRDGAYLGFRKE